MKSLADTHAGLPTAGAIGVGERSLQLSRLVAGARTKLGNRGLSRLDADLAALAWITERSVFEHRIGTALPLRVLHYAREFVRLLPVSAPVPSPMVTDDGLLSFEWRGENTRYLAVMVSEDGMLVYNGRLGQRRRISGAEPLSGELPAPIRQSLQDVIG
ncbi:MAG: hypothetical protein KJ011_02540 [Burkholderiaceae bacterium]|nr:hypothetical protein [Burkholderiaceae bacterium]